MGAPLYLAAWHAQASWSDRAGRAAIADVHSRQAWRNGTRVLPYNGFAFSASRGIAAAGARRIPSRFLI